MSKRKSSRRTSHRKAHSHKNRTRNIAVIAAPLAVIAASITGAVFYEGDVKPDVYGCYASEKQHVSAIFVDNSLNSLTPAQLRDYGDAFAKTYNDAPANAKLALYSTASDKAGSMATPRFIMCKPAANKDEQKRIGAPDKPTAYLKRRADDAKVRFAALTEDVFAIRKTPRNWPSKALF